MVVIFDKSASMGELHGKVNVNQDTRLAHGKATAKNMIATIPEIKLNSGLRKFWAEETVMIYGMKPLAKEEYTAAIDTIDFVYGRTPMDKAITASGNDLKGAAGNSALIIVSDFSEKPGIDDIRSGAVQAAITQLNADYGDRLCVYAIQVGYTLNGKELSEQIVQNVAGGYTVNADKLVSPAAMGAFVEKVIAGKCERYKELVVEKVVIQAEDAAVQEQIVAAVAEKKVVILAFEDVHFDFDKSTLTPEAKAILKRDIQVLKDNPKAKVRLAGYTSASGTEAYNQALSERRAAAVQDYLISEGIITPDRLTTIGYGETDPAMYEAAPKQIYSKAAKANMRCLFEIVVE
ncbi:MAG: OmpA family protein [Deltaproteobacteria bacterium]|nr:OmpA family protein [Deltaproteobacteria bacterium]